MALGVRHSSIDGSRVDAKIEQVNEEGRDKVIIHFDALMHHQSIEL